MKGRIWIFILLSMFMYGCGWSTRSLVGGYRLQLFDEGGQVYYVVAPGDRSSGGGVFDGTIEEIGWNQDWILARVNRLYRGDTSGWYALEVKTGRIVGPFEAAELRTNAILSRIKTLPPTEVFKRRR